MSGPSWVTASYNSNPRFRGLFSDFTIASVLGVNPADLAPVNIPNIRGQIDISIISTDNNYTSTFAVVGGFGEFRDQYTQNFYFIENTNSGCTIINTSLNNFLITTPIGDAGGRTYALKFIPYQSFPPSIQQTSLNVLGAANLIVKTRKITIVEGF